MSSVDLIYCRWLVVILLMLPGTEGNGGSFGMPCSTDIASDPVVADSGMLTSPNYPETFDNLVRCFWNLRPVSNNHDYVLIFTFEELELSYSVTRRDKTIPRCSATLSVDSKNVNDRRCKKNQSKCATFFGYDCDGQKVQDHIPNCRHEGESISESMVDFSASTFNHDETPPQRFKMNYRFINCTEAIRAIDSGDPIADLLQEETMNITNNTETPNTATTAGTLPETTIEESTTQQNDFTTESLTVTTNSVEEPKHATPLLSTTTITEPPNLQRQVTTEVIQRGTDSQSHTLSMVSTRSASGTLQETTIEESTTQKNDFTTGSLTVTTNSVEETKLITSLLSATTITEPPNLQRQVTTEMIQETETAQQPTEGTTFSLISMEPTESSTPSAITMKNTRRTPSFTTSPGSSGNNDDSSVHFVSVPDGSGGPGDIKRNSDSGGSSDTQSSKCGQSGCKEPCRTCGKWIVLPIVIVVIGIATILLIIILVAIRRRHRKRSDEDYVE